LANLSYRAGEAFSQDAANANELDEWNGLVSAMGEHLKAHDLNLGSAGMHLSPMLEIDPGTGRFSGGHGDLANRFLKREYRKGFEVPKLA
jgi:hypothetical protein